MISAGAVPDDVPEGIKKLRYEAVRPDRPNHLLKTVSASHAMRVG